MCQSPLRGIFPLFEALSVSLGFVHQILLTPSHDYVLWLQEAHNELARSSTCVHMATGQGPCVFACNLCHHGRWCAASWPPQKQSMYLTEIYVHQCGNIPDVIWNKYFFLVETNLHLYGSNPLVYGNSIVMIWKQNLYLYGSKASFLLYESKFWFLWIDSKLYGSKCSFLLMQIAYSLEANSYSSGCRYQILWKNFQFNLYERVRDNGKQMFDGSMKL